MSSGYFKTGSGKPYDADTVDKILAEQGSRNKPHLVDVDKSKWWLPGQFQQWSDLLASVGGELVAAERERAGAMSKAVRSCLEDANVIVPSTQARVSDEAISAVQCNFMNNVRAMQLAGKIVVWDEEGTPREAAKRRLIGEWLKGIEKLPEGLQSMMRTRADAIAGLKTRVRGVPLLKYPKVDNDEFEDQKVVETELGQYLEEQACIICEQRVTTLRPLEFQGVNKDTAMVLEGLRKKIPGIDTLRQLMVADIDTVRKHLKLAQALEKAASKRALQALAEDLLNLQEEQMFHDFDNGFDSPQTPRKELDLQAYTDRLQKGADPSDNAAYMPAEYVFPIKNVLETLEDFKLFMAMYRDREWSNDVEGLLGEEALLTAMLQKSVGGEDGVYNVLNTATRAFEVKSLVCRRLSRKVELVNSMGRNALTADWDQLLKDVK